MSDTVKDTSKEYCRILYDILLAKGVKEIVLSPGSRNAPLLIGAACRPFRRHIITDERTAAFVALGISLASGNPAALACTSGTALYDYSPAIAEAFYQNIPLIIITADRPAEWIDQDDSQTLIQPEALVKIVKGSYDIPVEHPDNKDEKWYVNRIINEACNLALSGRKGPVHINIHLDNPLTETVVYEPSNPRIINFIDDSNLLPHIYKRLADELRGQRILVTAGFKQPDNKLNKAIAEFGRLPQVAVMCETISNLHLDGDPYAIDSVLSLVERDEEMLGQLRPDVVISFGGALISRKLKEFLRKAKPTEHWTLNDTRPAADCFKSLTKHIEAEPTRFFRGIAKHLKRCVNDTYISYSDIWRDARNKAKESCRSFLESHREWSEMSAFDIMLSQLPSNYNLFLSNGTAVRYGQLFTDRIPHASFGCRGVSGIDGTTATAAGTAIAYKGPTLLITGDMSMAYDTGVLGLRDIPPDFKIAVINNKGGGIFRFIPSTRNYTDREELFCASPVLPLEKLAVSYGWRYFKAESIDEMNRNYKEFLECRQNAILEITSDEILSAHILTDYMNRK